MWFTVKNKQIIAYSNVKSDESLLPVEITEIERHVENPLIFIGQHISSLDVKDFIPVATNDEILYRLRNNLRKLYNEIQFREEIGDDVESLKAKYVLLKNEYSSKNSTSIVKS